MIMEKKVTWLELFYDLLFVAAVAKASHVLLHAEHGVITFEYLMKFVLIFIPVWWHGWVRPYLSIGMARISSSIEYFSSYSSCLLW